MMIRTAGVGSASTFYGLKETANYHSTHHHTSRLPRRLLPPLRLPLWEAFRNHIMVLHHGTLGRWFVRGNIRGPLHGGLVKHFDDLLRISATPLRERSVYLPFDDPAAHGDQCRLRLLRLQIIVSTQSHDRGGHRGGSPGRGHPCASSRVGFYLRLLVRHLVVAPTPAASLPRGARSHAPFGGETEMRGKAIPAANSPPAPVGGTWRSPSF